MCIISGLKSGNVVDDIPWAPFLLGNPRSRLLTCLPLFSGNIGHVPRWSGIGCWVWGDVRRLTCVVSVNGYLISDRKKKLTSLLAFVAGRFLGCLGPCLLALAPLFGPAIAWLSSSTTRAAASLLASAFAAAASSFFFFSRATSLLDLRGAGRSTTPGADVVRLRPGGFMIQMGGRVG